MAKNKNIRIYFDEWGGRCYLFTEEFGKHYMFKKGSKKSNLDLNMDAFKGLGGKYIFSAIPINNAKENGLVLDRVFTKRKRYGKFIYTESCEKGKKLCK